MICEVCGEKPAKLHVTQIQGGKPVSVHLCHDCAKKKGMGTSFSLTDLLSGLLEQENASPVSEKETSIVTCRGCGQSFSTFRETGRLGCSLCYTTFEENLLQLVGKIQKSDRHMGKFPKKGRQDSIINLENELREFRRKLNMAVQQEEFETAARLRDQIRSLEKELTKKSV